MTLSARQLLDTYRDGLLGDTLPFWTRHAIDREYGGFLFCLDRDGSVLDTDKGLWQHGRFTWLLATLYRTLEPREEWLDLARHGLDFLECHGFDADGRMFFQVTRDGRPLRKRRYVFTEAFAAMAFAAYGAAAGDERVTERARDLLRLLVNAGRTPGAIPSKVDPATRPQKGLAFPMTVLATAQVLVETLDDDFARSEVDSAIAEIERDFVNDEHEAVLETVGPQGEFLDHFEGRTLNPGHAIEAAWFILEESRRRGGDARLTALGTKMLDWMWVRGWDAEYGGVLYFTDVSERPVQEYWHDMKFWWPQTEAILATLLAYRMTGDERYRAWHAQVHEWAYARFPDPEFGEWYGYLHRDGRISVPLKGNLWKGPFHLPRMQMQCARWLAEDS